jgi:hypothetical protein
LAIFFQSNDPNNNLFKKAIYHALNKFDKEQASLFIEKIMKEKLYGEIKNKNKMFSELKIRVNIREIFMILFS